MFISIVLRTEYSPYSYRANFYLQALNACINNRWILITNEYMKYHHQEMQDGIAERFLKEFNIRTITPSEFDSIEQYYIPDKLFEDKEIEYKSRTKVLSFFAKESYPELEICIEDIIQKIRENHPGETIEGVLHCAEAFQPIRNAFNKQGIPVIPYLFSSIKQPHGYRETLYYANTNGFLYSATESEARFKKFIAEDSKFPVFSHRELIALIGKQRSLPLIQLIHHAPYYEMGLCGECNAIIPAYYDYNPYTDDDMVSECKELYKPQQMVFRPHAFYLDQIMMSRDELHNDPAAFILGSKRVAASRSWIILKSLLWGRPSIMKMNTCAFSFMCERDYRSTNTVDLKALNHFIFCYLVPEEYMFSDDYWKWRMSKPSETAIYKKHLDFYMKKLNLPEDILNESSEEIRLKAILVSRGCDAEVLSDVMTDEQDYDIDYYVASSRFEILGNPHWRLNKKKDNGQLVCRIMVTSEEAASGVDFFPLDDVAGFARIESIIINGKKKDILQDVYSFKFMPKVRGHYHLDLDANSKNPITLEIVWEYRKVFDMLNSEN